MKKFFMLKKKLLIVSALILISLFILLSAGCSLLGDIDDIRKQAMENNGPITGEIVIDGIARVEETLSVDASGISGIGTFFYQWSREGVGPIGTNSSEYYVEYDDIGYTITVTVTRSHSVGSVTSEPTAVIISKIPLIVDFYIDKLLQTYGQVVPVMITPKEGRSTGEKIIYYNGSTELPVNSGEYVITFDVKAEGDWEDAYGIYGGILIIEKAAGAMVSRPQNSSALMVHYEITVNEVTLYGGGTEQTEVEYNISRSSGGTGFLINHWQSDTKFTGLESGTVYYVYARSKETANYNAGMPNISNGITTTIPVTGVNLPSAIDIVIGQSRNITPVITPQNATYQTASWSSSNAAVVAVNNGIVTALDFGTAIITFKTDNDSYVVDCVVTVYEGGFTIGFFQVEDNAPDIIGPTIHHSGANGPRMAVLEIDDPGQYSSIDWYINGIHRKGDTFILNSQEFDNTGVYKLTIEVVKDGIPYSRTVAFTVAE